MALTEVDAARLNDNVFNTVGPFKNRIINGDMRIDQRNAGAAVTATSSRVYVTDRWFCQEDTDGSMTVQQSTTAPAGFTNSLLVTVTGTDSSIGAAQFAKLEQRIEGYNVADFAFGTASAKTITLSFQVRSSVTGTYSGAVYNSPANRSYPFEYTISAANTWESKTVTIAGDTSGTWLTDNGIGISVVFPLALGSDYQGTGSQWNGAQDWGTSNQTNLLATNGATFYITGVQLEAGSVATPFERRSYGQELALCQRYFATVGDGGNPYAVLADGRFSSATVCSCRFRLPVTMRATPSATAASATYALWDCYNLGNARSVGAITIYSAGSDGVEGDIVTSSATNGAYAQLRGNAAAPNAPRILFSAEL